MTGSDRISLLWARVGPEVVTYCPSGQGCDHKGHLSSLNVPRPIEAVFHCIPHAASGRAICVGALVGEWSELWGVGGGGERSEL